MKALGDDGCVAEEITAEPAGDARRHRLFIRALQDGGAVGARAGCRRSLPASHLHDDFCIINQMITSLYQHSASRNPDE